MLYCIAAYAAPTATVCPSGQEPYDLHDCCISADTDSKGGEERGRGVTQEKGDRGGNESKGERFGEQRE